MRGAPTSNEARLWKHLRNRQLADLKFRRQVPIAGYIADFLCVEARLIVEADGPTHDDSAYDRERDIRLRIADYRVLRFTNQQISQQLQSVLATICVAAGRQPSDTGAASSDPLRGPPSPDKREKERGRGAARGHPRTEPGKREKGRLVAQFRAGTGCTYSPPPAACSANCFRRGPR